MILTLSLFFLVSQSKGPKILKTDFTGQFPQAFNDRYISLYRPSAIYDLEKQKLYQLPTNNDYRTNGSFIDPVASPAGNLLVYPNPLRFFKLNDLLRDQQNAKPFFEDSAHRGWYESIGVLAQSTGSVRLRVMTSQDYGRDADGKDKFEDRGAFRDYDVTLDSNGNPTNVSPVQGAPTALCANQDLRVQLDWSTPIISKNGREFAVYNRISKTTKIYSIDGDSQNCKEVEDLGIATSKVNFSFDGRRVAFNATQISSKANSILAQRVLIYDRKTKSIASPMTEDSERVSGSYPAFLPNGQLLYMRKELSPNGALSESLVIVDPQELSFQPMRSEGSQSGVEDILVRVTDAARLQCQEPPHAASRVPSAIEKSCGGCHNAWSAHPIPFENKSLMKMMKSTRMGEKSLLDAASTYVSTGQMPPGGLDSKEVRKEILDYLNPQGD